MKQQRILLMAPQLCVFAIASWLVAACDGRDSPAVREVVIYTSVDQVFAEPVLREF